MSSTLFIVVLYVVFATVVLNVNSLPPPRYGILYLKTFILIILPFSCTMATNNFAYFLVSYFTTHAVFYAFLM